jgi:glycosyltransferase involved in cell wall biosynthesis
MMVRQLEPVLVFKPEGRTESKQIAVLHQNLRYAAQIAAETAVLAQRLNSGSGAPASQPQPVEAPARRQILLYVVAGGGFLVGVAFFAILIFRRNWSISKTETTPYNILHLLSTNRLSGAERVVQLIARHLDPGLFRIIIACGGDPLRKVYEAGGHTVEVADVRLPTLRNVIRLRSIVRSRKVRLIHAHDHRASLLAWLGAGFPHRIPVVSHIHNANPWLKGRHPYRLVELLMRNRYDISVACSDMVRKYFLRHNFTLLPTKVVTVTNGIEIKDWGRVNRDLVAQNLGLPIQHFIFGTVGRLDEQKGIDLLLEAFKEVTGRLEDVYLLVVGTGPDEQGLKKLARELGINERVIFTGYREDVYDLMQIMNVFVLASRWEGLPMVLMEAMARGVPVIASDVGGVKELVRPEETGLLFVSGDTKDLAQKMCYLCQEKEVADRLAEAGSELVSESFNVVHQVQKIEKIYSAFLPKRGPSI